MVYCLILIKKKCCLTGVKCNVEHVAETTEMVKALRQYAKHSKHFKTTRKISQVMPKGGSVEGNVTHEETSRSEGAGVKLI